MVWKIHGHLICRRPSLECRNYTRQGIRESPGNIHFPWQPRRKCQPLHRRAKIRRDVTSVAARVNTIPTVTLKMNRNQTVKTKGSPGDIEGQPLVTKCRRNPAGTKQRGQQMAFGVAKACSVAEHIRGDACDN